MKRTILILFWAIATMPSYAQSDTTKSVSEQIKIERDNQLNELRTRLKNNEDEIKLLTDRLSMNETNQTQEKIRNLERLQLVLDRRTKTLEETPITKTNFNGQLAFTELLSIREILNLRNSLAVLKVSSPS